MIIIDVQQQTEEWKQERIGRPSASNFDKIIQMSGSPSKSKVKYLYQLAGELITGTREEGYQNSNMTRGIEMEGEAREYYELVTGTTVDTVGLCYYNEDKKYCCSPDGLIGKDGGIEIKCPTLAVHVGYLLDNKLPSDYYQQVQGNLFITGRKWWDFVSYYPGMKPLIIRVDRDETFISALHAQLDAFCIDLVEVTDRLRRL